MLSTLIVGPPEGPWRYPAAARGLGMRVSVALTRDQADAIPREAARFVDELVVVDRLDAAALLGEADRIRFTDLLTAVVPGSEQHAAAAALLAARHGLPTGTPLAADAVTDRPRLLGALQSAGVPGAPAFRLAAGAAQAADAGRALGWPCVLRPLDRALGDPVLVGDALAVAGASWAISEAARAGGADQQMLLEPYAPGPEYTVIGHLHPHEQQVTLVAVAERTLGQHPHFQPLGQLVSPAHAVAWARQAAAYLTLVTRALEVRVGVVRAHLRRNDGEFTLTGFGTGPGPDLLPELVHEATGVDLAAVDLALRSGLQPPEPAARTDANAGVLYIAAPYPHAGPYRRLRGWNTAARTSGVVHAEITIEPGAPIPDRYDRSSRIAYLRYRERRPAAAQRVRDRLARTVTVTA